MVKFEAAYGMLAGQLGKSNNAMILTEEYAHKQVKKEQKWEEIFRPANIEALQKIRRYIRVKIRDI
jgi:hypothetical protein